MDQLWKKETDGAESVYVNIFENVCDNYSSLLNQIQSLNLSTIKDDKSSTDYRNKGNAQFAKSKFVEAMELYNKSLCYAKVSSENVSLAYANRSSCFLNLGMYEKCLVDIEMAIKANYPEHLMPKLEKRRSDCLKKTGKKVESNDFVAKLSFPADENFPGMANALKIESNLQFGRHVVAKCDIEVGKTVLIDEPFVSVAADFIECASCLKKFMNLIPCDRCNNTALQQLWRK